VEAPIHAFWCRIPSRANFGDALTPWLIRRLTGRGPRFARPGDGVPKHLVAGSVLAYADERSTVWGAGIISRSDHVDPAARILAVRGPLSRERALDCGADCPELYGDPALLLPRVVPAAVPAHERRGGGVVPHFSDMPRVGAAWRDPSGLDLIDVQSPVERFLDRLTRREWIASSSLHGIVAAHAYGIPAAWVSFGDLPSGDGSKFRDYFLSIGADVPEPVRVSPGKIDATALERHLVAPQLGGLDLDLLWERCPFT
jgi:pyruvyltransferase